MRPRNSLLAVGLLCLAYLPVYGSSSKRTAAGCSAACLHEIRLEAANAQHEAEEIAADVWHTQVSRELVADRVAYLAGHVKRSRSLSLGSRLPSQS